MAGSSFEIRIDDAQTRAELSRLMGQIKDLRPAMKNIGEHLVLSTWERFKAGVDPKGRPWKPLQVYSAKSRLAKRLAKGKKQILVGRGHLRDSITYRAGSDEVTVGTNRVYAAIHQFGGKTKAHEIKPYRKKGLAWPGGAHPVKVVRHPGSQIPARPFLGMSAQDWTETIAILMDHLERGKH